MYMHYLIHIKRILLSVIHVHIAHCTPWAQAPSLCDFENRYHKPGINLALRHVDKEK